MIGGPPPTPTKLRLLKGDTSKGNKPIPKNDPSLHLKAEIPAMPSSLRDRRAREEYKHMSAMLKGAGILSRIDQRVLMLYCDSFSVYREAMEDIKKNGLCYYSDKGNRLANPMTHTMQAARHDMLRYLQEMGCTPAARVRVQWIGEDEKKDDFSVFLAEAK